MTKITISNTTYLLQAWPQEAIDKMKKEIDKEIKTTPAGQKIGKIEWVEVTSPSQK